MRVTDEHVKDFRVLALCVILGLFLFPSHYFGEYTLAMLCLDALSKAGLGGIQGFLLAFSIPSAGLGFFGGFTSPSLPCFILGLAPFLPIYVLDMIYESKHRVNLFAGLGMMILFVPASVCILACYAGRAAKIFILKRSIHPPAPE